MTVFIAVLGLCAIALIWTVTWFGLATHRNEQTAAFRKQLVKFAYHDLVNWQDRSAWYDSQPSYAEMSAYGALAMFTNKPLSQMIGGKYEEEFWRWRTGDMRPERGDS